MNYIPNTLVVLMLLSGSLGKNVSETISPETIKFAANIIDCFFIEPNNMESVELICDNETIYPADDCYKLLFEDESMNATQRSKVLDLRTGTCECREFDDSLAELFPNLITLNISYNLLNVSISGQNLKFNHLQNLNASWNHLRTIEDHMFIHAQNITRVDFSANAIERVSQASFKGAAALTWLTISHNRIVYLQESTFEDLKNLQVLDLSYNSLHIFDINMLKTNLNLLQIHLQNNMFVRIIYNAENQPKFRSLNYFDIGQNFMEFNCVLLIPILGPAMQVLNWSTNALFQLNDDTFKDLRNLQHVNFTRTRLQTFNFSAFENPNELRSLDLSSNYLTTIWFTSDYHFDNLETLKLENNLLTQLDGASPMNFPTLKTIDISQNQLSCRYAMQFVQQWTGLTDVGNPCNQKKLVAPSISAKIFASKVNVVAFLCFVTLVFVFALLFFDRRKKLIENVKNPAKPLEFQPSYVQRIENVYEEPIYYEIEPSQPYDRLNFGVLRISTIKSHYHNATNLKR